MSFNFKYPLAVEKTITYFNIIDSDKSARTPKFLWNAKMRFGKTFATYQLAKKMGLKRVLVLTFKPAVESAWHDDLVSHIDFEGGSLFLDQTLLASLTPIFNILRIW